MDKIICCKSHYSKANVLIFFCEFQAQKLTFTFCDRLLCNVCVCVCKSHNFIDSKCEN